MSKFIKLPARLKDLKITDVISDIGDVKKYKAVKKDFKGTEVNVVLYTVCVSDENYTEKNVTFIRDEAEFLQNVASSGNKFNYLDIYFDDNSSKKQAELYIITEELKTLSEILGKKAFNEGDIIDFGIQMSGILEALEVKNIYHGNVSPDNIFVTSDGKYKLGGFSDFESRITDLSYIAPEIYRKEDADFTTDIYSLGLIMYIMCNNGRLPYQTDGISAKEASEKRFSAGDFSAPENGSRELKSIIMIACKSENKHRWKNAENITNALLSIKDSSVQNQPNNESENISSLVAAPTDFDNNDFDSYDYDDFTEEKPEEDFVEETSADNVTQNTTDNVSVAVNENKTENDNIMNMPQDEDDSEINNISVPVVSSQQETKNEEITDSDIFDNFESKGKNALKTDFDVKDYGSYFEDDSADTVTENTEKSTEDKSTSELKSSDENFSVFDTDGSSNENISDFDDNIQLEEKTKSKRNVALIVICIIVILAALGFIAYCIINSLGNPQNKPSGTPATTSAATTAATAPITTIPATTAEPTTISNNKDVVPVVGYGYSYGKELLEAEGFTVEISYYDYSSEYPEGYIISQTPEGNAKAEKGSVVSLVISLGEEVAETEEPATEEQKTTDKNNSSSAQNNTYVFANSDSAYLSRSEVEALSRDQLNIALNEIYARHGRIFLNSTLSEYFNSQSWYTPKYSPSEFDANVEFNEYEQANLELMIDVQEEKGYR